MERNTFGERFISLPEELQYIIVKMLEPAILYELQNCLCKTLNDLSRNIRYGNFEACRNMSAACIISFVQARADHITSLNFNDCCYPPFKNSLICELVEQCSNLTSLSVANCNLTDIDISRIFSRLDLIKDFTWNVKISDRSKVFSISKKQCSLTKISLLILNANHLAFVYAFFFECCPLLQDITIRIGEIADRLKKSDTTETLNFPNLHSLAITFFNFTGDSRIPVHNFCTLTSMLQQAKPPTTRWRKFFVQSLYSIKTEADIDLKFIDLTTGELAFPWNIISQLKNKTVTPLKAIALHASSPFAEEPVQWIEKHGNSSLKLLSVTAVLHDPKISQPADQIYTLGNYCMTGLFTRCNNIAALNLHGCHFIEAICYALSLLKGLKYLTIDSCGLTGYESRILPKEKDPVLDQSISGFIASCAHILEFKLHDCSAEPGWSIVRDNDLEDLHKWTQLKTLSLYNQPLLEKCAFLEKVATSCMYFKKLELVNVCKHFPFASVLCVMLRAKSLTYLKLYHQQQVHNLFNEYTMREAKSLETLCFCLSTFSQTTAKKATDAFMSAPRLQHLHVGGPLILTSGAYSYEYYVDNIMRVFRCLIKKGVSISVNQGPKLCQPCIYNECFKDVFM